MAKAKGAVKEVVDRLERRRLNWKDVTTIIVAITVLSGMLMSIVGWIHAEVTIPKILHQTSEQIKEAIKAHTAHPHPVSVPRREFEILTEGLKEDLGKVETAVKEFETEQKVRLDRIEEKVDRL